MSSLKIALIGGSGLAAALAAETSGTQHDLETPFGKPSAAIIETQWEGVDVLFLSRHGNGHQLNPGAVPNRANIFAIKALGATHVLASGAVGSLRDNLAPRHLVIPDQIIDKTMGRPATFYEKAAVHVEFAEPFCPVLRQILLETAAEMGPDKPVVHAAGTYVVMEGPAFSTRAESLMHRLWGGDIIGMTAIPEAKLAREAELPYATISLVTDFDSWKTRPATTEKADPFVLLNEIIGNLKSASESAIRLMRAGVARMAANPDRLQTCPALHALKLGIWTDKSWIDPAEVARLAPLWGKYFPA